MNEAESRRAREGKDTAQADLQKHVEALLAEVHAEAYRTSEPHTSALTRTVAKFATLLVLLGRQAEDLRHQTDTQGLRAGCKSGEVEKNTRR